MKHESATVNLILCNRASLPHFSPFQEFLILFLVYHGNLLLLELLIMKIVGRVIAGIGALSLSEALLMI